MSKHTIKEIDLKLNIVTSGGSKAHTRVVKIKPIANKYYDDDGSIAEIKYVCPICQAAGEHIQFHYNDENCPTCGVNFDWNGVEREKQETININGKDYPLLKHVYDIKNAILDVEHFFEGLYDKNQLFKKLKEKHEEPYVDNYGNCTYCVGDVDEHGAWGILVYKLENVFLDSDDFKEELYYSSNCCFVKDDDGQVWWFYGYCD